MNNAFLSSDSNETAIALHSALAAVDLAKVAVKSTERHPEGGRKALAKMAREVFRSLGLKGISVTAPNYSMAMGVDVAFPARRDYKRDEEAGDVAHDCPARASNNAANEKITAILLAAFPKTDNRSDSQSDHFDFVWSISRN